MRYDMHIPHSTHDIAHATVVIALLALILGIPFLIDYLAFGNGNLDALRNSRQMINVPFPR